jgi:carbon-monoxide dehydrogenase large subunit
MSTRVELARGDGRFLADLCGGDVLWACFVRSTIAHGWVKRVALNGDGQTAGARLHTGTDIAGMVHPIRVPGQGLLEYDTFPLARDKVLFAGEPLAVVLAEDAYAAEDGADAVEVEYESLPTVATPAEGLTGETLLHEALGTNVLFSQDTNYEEAEEALGAAPVQVEHTFRYPRQTPVPLHGRGALATYDRHAATLTVHTSTQAPFAVRTAVAQSLGIPEQQVRVIRPDVGGGFGSKSHVFGEELAIAVLAYHLQRPVCWVEDRRESLISAIHAHEAEMRLRVGATADGELVALVADVLADVGAHSIRFAGATLEPFTVSAALLAPYRLPKKGVRARGVATNKAPAGAYRGVGFVPGVFAGERLMDLLADRLGVDPVEVRRRNLLMVEEFPFTSPIGHLYDSGDYLRVFEAALEKADYEAQRAEQQSRSTGTRRIGIGVAAAHMPAALGSAAFRRQGSPMLGGYDAATVRVAPDGSVQALLSSSSTGQGHDETYRQLVGRLLGLPEDQVTIVEGDTALCPVGTATLADRSAVVVGAALHLACGEVLEKAKRIASIILGVDESEVEIARGIAFARNQPDQSVSFETIARAAYLRLPSFNPPKGMDPGLESTRHFDPENPTYGFAGHVATVEVDTEDGTVRVLRYVMAKDPGEIINERIVHEQGIGSIAVGIGNVLFESMVYDSEGQPLTASLMDYLLPTATDIPPIELVDVPTPSTTPGGYRGAGNLGTVGTPAAIANAVADALRGEAVGVLDEVPVTPDRVLRLLGKLGGDTSAAPPRADE